MKLNSDNEWSPLKAVVVGTVEGFSPGLEVRGAGRSVPEAALELARGAYPQWYLSEVAEDLEDLCAVFRQAGVTVLRPSWTEESSQFATPNWSAAGFDIYNVRDVHIVLGTTLISSAPSSRFRLFETYAFHRLFYETFFEDNFKWIVAPLPKLKGPYLRELRRPISPLEAVEDQLHRGMSHGLNEDFRCLAEDEIIFDAANIIRLDKDILYLVSNTGNRKAAKWLEGVLGSDYSLHVTQAYRSSHLDSTVLPLRPGFVLLNGARVNADNCPGVLKGWEQLYFTDVAAIPDAEVSFHRSTRLRVHEALLQMGVLSTLDHISSPWAGLNVMSIDPNTVLVHDRQVALIHALEVRRFTVIPVRMRHCYTMLGGLHCVTLDVVRDSHR